MGQVGAAGFGPCQALDYEVEVGFFVGPGNALGCSISIDDADSHIFGLCLLNDWSARDVQRWESTPLGPFLGKSFATTLSPWIVTLEALEPYRVPAMRRPQGDPAPLPYLFSETDQQAGAFDITVEALLLTEAMRNVGHAPTLLSRGNLRDLYWTPAQMVTHHTSNGCNLLPGDLLGSGTTSGFRPDSLGCLLEITHDGTQLLVLPNGEQRCYLLDGDEVIFHALAQRSGLPRIGFGQAAGWVMQAP